MKRSAVLLVLPLVALADDAQTARKRLDEVYRREDVRVACTEGSEQFVTVTVDGMAFEVDCEIWRRWNDQQKKKRPE